MQQQRPIRVAITHGDINGIGYELLLKIFAEPAILELFTPVIYGSSDALAYWRETLKMADAAEWRCVNTAKEARDGVVNILNICTDELTIEPGRETAMAGRAALEALDAAVEDVQNGLCQVLVTAPINKAAMPQELFPYKGHTDYLEAKVAGRDPALMILVGGETRVALATTHCALKEVPASLSMSLIVEKIGLLAKSLARDFGIAGPRIGVLGLNPHNGDNGLMGNEEKMIIRPAIEQAGAKRHLAFGPLAADGFWGSDAAERYHGILAMYHDQGLAPFKALYMDSGVNFTAGLSIVRTSPDHGTGFDIAGRGVASPNSMRQAIYTAIDIYRRRMIYEEASKNPLRKTFFDRGNDNEKLETLTEEA